MAIENVSDVYGFNGNAVVNNNILNISNSKFTSGIANNLNLNLNSTNKTTSINTINGTITGVGTTTVQSGKTLFGGDVTQDSVVVQVMQKHNLMQM